MSQFSFSVAGFIINVDALYTSTRDFCREFLADGPVDFSVVLRHEDIERERTFTKEPFSAESLETLALLRSLSQKLIQRDTILFHGSALAVDGKGYIFTAPSGTGKTTHTRLWLQTVPGSYVLNGDKPFLRLKDNQVWVCGSPWRGKENYGINEMLPLEAICILERDSFDHIEKIQNSEAMVSLIRQTYRPDEPLLLMKSLQLIGDIAQAVRLYQLGCTMNPNAARVSSKAMIRK